MKKTILCIILSASTALSSVAFAQSTENKYTTIYNQCTSSKDMNNGVVYECANLASDAAKKEIERLYFAMHSYLLTEDVDNALKLETSQKAWLEYRDTHCELMGSYVGSPSLDICNMALNGARVEELQEMLGDN